MVELFCTHIGAKTNFGAVMKQIGIIKEIDELGRLQIPKEIRVRLGLDRRVQLIVTQDGLLIKSDEYRLVKANDTEHQ